jgi:transposase
VLAPPSPPPKDDDHECGWKAYAEAQERFLKEMSEQLESVQAQLAELKRARYGKKSEKRKSPKMPPPVRPESDPQAAAAKRQHNAKQRDLACETEVVPVPANEGRCTCRECSSEDIHVIGSKQSIVYEHVREHFRKRVYDRQTVKCHSCGHVETGPAPKRFGERGRYAASFVAHLIYTKWVSSMPQHRLEKSYRAQGIPLSRSTMCDLVHRAATELDPIYLRLFPCVREATDVHADETTIRQQGLDKKAYLWVFVTSDVILYRYATTRSGSVPSEVLGDSAGRLVVDQYTGYNHVTTVGNRIRGGCLAHARRKIFEQNKFPEADEALELISEIYRIEVDAKKAKLTQDELLEVRQRESKPIFTKLLCWGRRYRGNHEPRSAMGKAIRYVLKNRRALGCFLRYPSIPPDNNPAEAAMRRPALGRVNYLSVGNERTGYNHAVLYSLVATCEKHGVNPIDYLADVLMRLQDHPASRIDELLPHRWKPPDVVTS